jgi:hypothetical protein
MGREALALKVPSDSNLRDRAPKSAFVHPLGRARDDVGTRADHQPGRVPPSPKGAQSPADP